MRSRPNTHMVRSFSRLWTTDPAHSAPHKGVASPCIILVLFLSIQLSLPPSSHSLPAQAIPSVFLTFFFSLSSPTMSCWIPVEELTMEGEYTLSLCTLAPVLCIISEGWDLLLGSAEVAVSSKYLSHGMGGLLFCSSLCIGSEMYSTLYEGDCSLCGKGLLVLWFCT